MQRLRPAGRAHLRLRILDALYYTRDSTSASTAAGELQMMTTVGLPGAAADNCVLAQWRVWRGELEDTRRLLDVLKTQSEETPMLAGVQPAVCVPLVEAQLSVAARESEAAARVRTFDAFAFTSSGAGDLTAYANIAAAEMHQKLNAPQDALAAIRRGPWGAFVWPRYRDASSRLERELCALPSLAQQCKA